MAWRPTAAITRVTEHGSFTKIWRYTYRVVDKDMGYTYRVYLIRTWVVDKDMGYTYRVYLFFVNQRNMVEICLELFLMRFILPPI